MKRDDSNFDMLITSPALRYHGAKFRLAKWVMQFFPEHTCYVEPFGGAAGVLLQKPRAYAEVYNDLDQEIVNFFRCIRDREQRAQLLEALAMTPCAREEFASAWDETSDPVERARRLCIRAQMGFGSAGATKGVTGFRIDTKRAYGTAQQLWAEYPANLAAVGERFTGVLIENRPAIEVMQQHDSANTLHFIDPPYVLSTRNSGNRTYRYEMKDDEHVQLLEAVLALKGFVVLSGYKSDLYCEALRDWGMHSTSSRISAGRGTALREEVVWISPTCVAALCNKPGQQSSLL